jgi:methylated-DNA-[protein]-cysteine S-methyltransferase
VSPQAFQAIVAAPGFRVGMRVAGDYLCELVFLPPGAETAASHPLAAEAARQVRAYLADPGFAFDLPLSPRGTPFQRAVWRKIAEIPPGRTRSYGELAAELGSAPRAVGQACGKNPYPLVVPCHRVISATGGLGGFANARDGYLLHTKRWLLRHEAAL